MSKFDVDKNYAAISYAETGSEKNPYIRTRDRKAPGGSTAFGPAQITGTLAENSYKAGRLKDSKDFYEKEMKPRYEKMKQSGNNSGKPGYNAKYDYGGDAEFDSAKHGQDYEVFSKEVMMGVAKEAKDDENEFVRKWRGKDEKQDPKYYERMRQGRKKFEDKMIEDSLGKEVRRQMAAME